MYNTKQISTHPFCRIARIEKSCYIFHYDPSFTISIVMQTLPTQPVALQLWIHTNRFTFAQKLPANCKHASECIGEMLQYYPFHSNQTLKHNKHYIPNALDCPFAVSSLHIRIGELKKRYHQAHLLGEFSLPPIPNLCAIVSRNSDSAVAWKVGSSIVDWLANVVWRLCFNLKWNLFKPARLLSLRRLSSCLYPFQLPGFFDKPDKEQLMNPGWV